MDQEVSDLRRTREALRYEALGTVLHVVGDAAEALECLRRQEAHAAPRPSWCFRTPTWQRSGRQAPRHSLLGESRVVIVPDSWRNRSVRLAQPGADRSVSTTADFRRLVRTARHISELRIASLAVRPARHRGTR